METKLPLRYHTGTSNFYEEEDILLPEPEETLEELEQRLAEGTKQYAAFQVEYKRVMEPYRNPETGKYDYDKLFQELNEGKEQADRAFQFGLCDFNSFNALEEYEFLVDLKIMHLNEKG